MRGLVLNELTKNKVTSLIIAVIAEYRKDS
jgi:hypothetical protein